MTTQNNNKRAHNAGSVSKNKSGSYRAQITLPGEARKTKSFRTKRECQQWIDEMRKQVEMGLNTANRKITVNEYAELWLENKKRSIRPTTYASYALYLERAILPVLGKWKLRDLTVSVVNKFYANESKNGRGEYALSYMHRILRTLFNGAVREGLMSFNPATLAEKPKPESRDIQIYSEAEIYQLLMAARGEPMEALFHIAVKTGMRQGEILGLTWSNLDMIRGEIRVMQQLRRIPGQVKRLSLAPVKTKYGRRIVPIGSDLVMVLQKHCNSQNLLKAAMNSRWNENDLIFTTSIGTPIDQRNLLRGYEKIQKLAGLRKLRFHDLRHTAASIMLRNGVGIVEVARILGHSSPAVTLKIYGHLVPGALDRIGSLMDRVLTPTPIDLVDSQVKV